jgi:hypothetical protein
VAPWDGQIVGLRPFTAKTIARHIFVAEIPFCTEFI